MNHSIEELEPLLSSLKELSSGRANAYVVAAEELSENYIHRLERLGVTGLVLMPWPVMMPESVSVEDKLKAMKSMSEKWIR
ncbi:MAG: hypothetical protein ACI9GW_000668 [Halieaceae bacterium]|jgi:hypothetical protein